MANWVPVVSVTLEKVTVAPVLLKNVTVWDGLVWLTSWLGKDRGC